MSSLTELNNYSNNTIAFTDNRPAGILLSYPTLRNIPNFVAESSSFAVERKIDIVEIINPQGTLNLTFSVDLSSVPGATLTWDTLFGGSITSEVNQVYSVRAIETIADWDFVKAPTITIPDDFQGSFEYTCTLTYLASSGLTSQSWTVGTFVPVVNLASEFTQTASPIMFKGVVNEEFTSSFTLLGGGLEFDIASADFASTFGIDADVDRLFRGFTTVQTVDTSLNASAIYVIGNLASNQTVTASMNVTADDPIGMISPLASTNWNWRSNQINFPFNNDTPVIYDDGGNYNYEIQLSCANGDFGTETSITTGTYSITGTKDNLNFGVIRDIAFYPDSGYTKLYGEYEPITFKLYRDGVLFYNETIEFRYVGNGFTGRNVEYTSSGTFTPTVAELRYSQMHYMLIGGGGGMSPDIIYPSPGGGNDKGNAGGGGGAVVYALNQTISNTSYSFTVGAGGTTGNSGGTTSGFGLTAPGGGAGTDTAIPYTINGTYSVTGGDSGNGNLGNLGQDYRDGASGGGAGAKAPGSAIVAGTGGRMAAYPYPNDLGGAGLRVATISGAYYGAGGSATYTNYNPARTNPNTTPTTYGSGAGEGNPTGITGAVIISTFTV
jgi:hypothetical protein